MDQFDKLTEKQRECLRLVSRGYSSKEIAITLSGAGPSIGKHAIDARITAAVRTLGAADRRDAARMLAEREAGTTYDRIIYDPPSLHDQAPDAPDGEVGDKPAASGLREERALYSVQHPSSLPVPFATKGRPRNDLDLFQRLAWIALITALFAGGTGAFILALTLI